VESKATGENWEGGQNDLSVSQETSLATALSPTTLSDGVFRDGKGHWLHRICTPNIYFFGDTNEKKLYQA